MQTPGISVVIPAYNEENFLPATLVSVNEARRLFSSSIQLPSEVVVVNNASTDQTEKIALAHDAVVIRHDIRNISSVRNAGIREASYTLIVTIDADCTFPPDALEKIWNFMRDDSYIGGALGVSLITDKRINRIVAHIIQTAVVSISGIYGAMFFFWRDAAIEIGGFPENRLVAEDSAFAIALRSHGRKQGKKFARLKSVQVGTLDRKDIRLRAIFPLIVQVIRVFAGAKQTPGDLKFWYDPDR
jgi:glycosyltransferase involved in cell wall biosynthesis